MSITLTPEMLSMLDSKTKNAVIAISKVPAGTIIVKPKKVLSPEHLAAMKAGREKKAAEKKALAPVTEASTSDSGSSEKKRGPKKLTDMTPEERAAHDVKVAERKAVKDAMTPEEKAALEVKKAAAKAAKAAKTMPAPASVPAAMPEAMPAAAPASVPVKVKKVIALKKSA